MVQSLTGPNGKRKHRARFANSAEGRRSQIAYKLGHGIRAVSPVLLGVEREEDWQRHYEGIHRSLNPGNEFEADLVFLIAWQLWRFGRLIRHETALTTQKIHAPPPSIFDVGDNQPLTKEAIASAITRLSNGDSPNGASSKEPREDPGDSFLSRCRALQSGASGVMFAPSEVRELLRLVLEQVHSRTLEREIDGDTEDGDEVEGDEDGQVQELTIEERPWSSGEIAGQLQILSDAAGLDWHEELTFAVNSLEEALEERAKELEEARQHVIRNLVLDEGNVARLSLYERQINAQFKSTYSLLERARAWRLGMPIPAPVTVDLTVSKEHSANGV